MFTKLFKNDSDQGQKQLKFSGAQINETFCLNNQLEKRYWGLEIVLYS